MLSNIYCTAASPKYNLGGHQIKIITLAAMGGGCVILLVAIIAIICVSCRKRNGIEEDVADGGKTYIFYLYMISWSLI